MKKLITALLAVALLLSVTACGGDKAATVDELKEVLAAAAESVPGSELSSDGLSLEIVESDLLSSIDFTGIETLNATLGFPDSVKSKMGATAAIDGTQREETDDFIISWWVSTGKVYGMNYKSLTVLYEINR